MRSSNYKRMYDKLGAPMEEDKLASGMSDGTKIIDAIKDPFALIGLASKQYMIWLHLKR